MSTVQLTVLHTFYFIFQLGNRYYKRSYSHTAEQGYTKEIHGKKEIQTLECLTKEAVLLQCASVL